MLKRQKKGKDLTYVSKANSLKRKSNEKKSKEVIGILEGNLYLDDLLKVES